MGKIPPNVQLGKKIMLTTIVQTQCHLLMPDLYALSALVQQIAFQHKFIPEIQEIMIENTQSL